jgi:predicted nucleic acid-binding protein
MKLVIDTNKIMAAMIKDSLSRRIISTPMFQFITPDHTLQELSKYEETIRKKTKLTHQEFNLLLSLIFEHIMIVPKEDYEEFLNTAKTLIEDINDAPFIALCLAIKADGIWSDDTHFYTQKQFTVFRTKDLLSVYIKH